MGFRAAVLSLIIIGTVAAVATAQPTPVVTQAPDRPGPYVIDVRGSTVGAPQAAGFYPAVPTGTLIPNRAYGFDLGGHVYLFQLGPARVGFGADLFRLRGAASPPEPVTSGSATTPQATSSPTPSAPTTPDITVSVATIAPQISLNFGTSTGWSYLSAGLGRGQVITERSAFDKGLAGRRESGSVTSQNFGGGARWFTSDHLAFTFDIRFHLLSPGEAQELEPGTFVPGTPRTRVVSASAGISLR